MIKQSSVSDNKTNWNVSIQDFSGVHILQSWEWGEFKSRYGWQVERFFWKNGNGQIVAAAQVLKRSLHKLIPSMMVWYIPRGPLMDWSDDKLRSKVLSDLKDCAKKEGAIFIKIDPEVMMPCSDLNQIGSENQKTGKQITKSLKDQGWLFSDEQIQFRNTLWIDLQLSEDQLLQNMKQKTRYNIRLAERKGVVIRRILPEEFPKLYKLYATTSNRDGFIIRSKEYYLDIWNCLSEKGMAQGLVAEVDGQAVAGLILFLFAHKAWYFYGMSSGKHHEKMPNYLLQWEAIRLAKEKDFRIYDLWGAPDRLEDETDSMSGVYRFKLGLGGKSVCTIGAWDFVLNKFAYYLYRQLLPKILGMMRKIRRGQIQLEAGG